LAYRHFEAYGNSRQLRFLWPGCSLLLVVFLDTQESK